MTEMYRQGDLLFIKTDRINTDATKKNDLVVLGSSITGHDHAITQGEVYARFPTWDDRASFYVSVPDGADLIHPEHGTIPLPAGVYKVIRQREVNGYVRD